jgi:hypothetical protein
MIRYSLVCEHDHAWDAWFASSASYDEQAARGLVACPICASTIVRKAPMAPAVVTSKAERPLPAVAAATPAPDTLDAPPQVKAFFEKWRAHVAENYDYVGDAFAAEARKIHEGETDDRLIYGETTPEEARALIEDGVPVAHLPAAASPRAVKKLN